MASRKLVTIHWWIMNGWLIWPPTAPEGFNAIEGRRQPLLTKLCYKNEPPPLVGAPRAYRGGSAPSDVFLHLYLLHCIEHASDFNV